MFHSPWPLFGDDLNLARSWIRPKLHGLVSVRTGHLAINLGLGDALLAGVSEGSVQAEIKALRQWRFRISRLHGDANPYRHLVPRWYFEKTLAAIATSKTAGLPLHVELNGGIGDHIEALSLLLPWTKTQDHTLNLKMSSERQKQIAPLLSKWKRIQCNVSLEHGHPEAPIKVMALRAALVSSNEPMHYRPFLISEQTRQSSGLHWLCCWRAEGRGDSLSAHSRSVPWALVWEFYHHIKSLQPKSCIVDITKGETGNQPAQGNGYQCSRPSSRNVARLGPTLPYLPGGDD